VGFRFSAGFYSEMKELRNVSGKNWIYWPKHPLRVVFGRFKACPFAADGGKKK
jgi:hypothetical protein